MSMYQKILSELSAQPKTWLVTGVAGFIGSNLMEVLLGAGQTVIGLDNFSTGKKENLAEVLGLVPEPARERFTFIQGDIRDLETCQKACTGVDYVLHQAALGSVPRSIENPLASHDTNVNGFLNMLVAARDQKVRRLVYASSSSVYGDEPRLPKVEEKTGQPLSPYAVTKAVNELYARVFGRLYGLQAIGLRYFNVFGPRQNPTGPYAAVIPRWIEALLTGQPVRIFGDGLTSRDFCFVANAVQANLLAATTRQEAAVGQVFNVALDDATSLNSLFDMIRARLLPAHPHLREVQPLYEGFRPGDIRASHADITKARTLLEYAPTHTLEQGLDIAVQWFGARAQTAPATAAPVEACAAAA